MMSLQFVGSKRMLDVGTVIIEPNLLCWLSLCEEQHVSLYALAGKNVTIVDTVYFYNLTAGQEYKLCGKIMDKESGKPVLINGKEVTAEAAFKPAVSTGTQDIHFTFDATDLAGKDVVVFEEIYCDGVKIAEHRDITDKGQTISFDKQEKPEKPKKPDKPKEEIPKTGDESAAGIYFLLMLWSLSARRKKRNERKKRSII